MKRAIICLMWVWVMGLGGNANAAFFGLFEDQVDPGESLTKVCGKQGFYVLQDPAGVVQSVTDEPCGKIVSRPWACANKDDRGFTTISAYGECSDEGTGWNNCAKVKSECEKTGGKYLD